MVEQSPVNKQLYYSASEYLGEACGIFNRDMVERAFFINPSFQNNVLPVWIKRHHVTVGLIRHDGSSLHSCGDRFIIIILYDGEYDL